MRKMKKHSKSVFFWLPIDERLIPQIISFGRVRGMARIFLGLEMLLATLIVLGTGLVVLLSKYQ